MTLWRGIYKKVDIIYGTESKVYEKNEITSEYRWKISGEREIHLTEEWVKMKILEYRRS